MGQAEGQADCLFCKIIARQIPAAIVKEGDHFVAIRDINPQAPTHILVIPKEHASRIDECADAPALGKLFQSACTVAQEAGLSSFRLVVNSGEDAGQTVFHLHIHVLGGRAMGWPPG